VAATWGPRALFPTLCVRHHLSVCLVKVALRWQRVQSRLIEVPLADEGGDIARRLEGLGQEQLAVGNAHLPHVGVPVHADPARLYAGEEGLRGRAKGHSSGIEKRNRGNLGSASRAECHSAGPTDGADRIRLRESDASRGERVDVWRWDHRPAVAAEVAVGEVVHQDQDQVGGVR